MDDKKRVPRVKLDIPKPDMNEQSVLDDFFGDVKRISEEQNRLEETFFYTTFQKHGVDITPLNVMEYKGRIVIEEENTPLFDNTEVIGKAYFDGKELFRYKRTFEYVSSDTMTDCKINFIIKEIPIDRNSGNTIEFPKFTGENLRT